MPREVACPHCGVRIPIDPTIDAGEPSALGTDHTVESVIPRTCCDAETDLPWSVPPEPEDGEPLFETASAPAGSGVSLVNLIDPPRRGLSEDTEARPSSVLQAPPAEAPLAEPAAAPSLSRVLLASYASAMTLACLWMWWHARPAARSPLDQPETVLRETPAEGFRGHRSRAVNPAQTLPPDHITPLGTPMTLGSVEFTPLSLEKDQVVLVYTALDGSRRLREGGRDALVLRIRLKNISENAVFAPLDEAFVREPDEGLPDSFLEAPDGSRIYLYPLPVTSDWDIDGQEFRELKPGEVFETILVSDKDASARCAPGLVWRLRLRTGIEPDQTDLVGVKLPLDPFHCRQVDPEPPPRPEPRSQTAEPTPPSAEPSRRSV